MEAGAVAKRVLTMSSGYVASLEKAVAMAALIASMSCSIVQVKSGVGVSTCQQPRGVVQQVVTVEVFVLHKRFEDRTCSAAYTLDK